MSGERKRSWRRASTPPRVADTEKFSSSSITYSTKYGFSRLGRERESARAISSRMAWKMGSGGGVWAVMVVRAKRAANRSRVAAEGRGQTGLPADFRQKAPEINGSLV